MSDAFLDALSMALRLRPVSAIARSGAQRDSPSALLARMALDERGVDGVGERELSKVLRDLLLHLVGLEPGYSTFQRDDS